MRKKEYIGCLIVLVLTYAWVLPGCGRQSGVFYQTAQNADAGNGSSDGESQNSAAGSDGAMRNAAVSESGTGTGNDAVSGNAAGEEAEGAAGTDRPPCYVHICGAVLHPGVYEVPEGSRLYEVILLAGGLCADACDHYVNQAQTVSDGLQVYIPTVQEAQEKAEGQVAFPNAASRTETEAESGDTRIDLNRASKEQLMTLPGIGGTRAQAIIAYREAHGGFGTIEELMEVSGIKQGVYDRLKEMIKV